MKHLLTLITGMLFGGWFVKSVDAGKDPIDLLKEETGKIMKDIGNSKTKSKKKGGKQG